MKKLLQTTGIALALGLCFNLNTQAQSKAKPAAKKAPATKAQAAPKQQELTDMSQMKTYYMALLKKGPYQPTDTAEVNSIQRGHMAHIRKMAADGKLVMAGPFLDNGDLRGIFIFDVATLEEAQALTQADPAVKAGKLIMELHPWMSQRGTTLP
ncbi:YciI family protein [uncultured Pontibacter sp.]|uniref:YciI family protein n=1 Tax=uncultured Pontibacter sp. TaxID=453356 RepID=UPI002633FCE6|nr:YciI family protein [uncultured Pontibacter sp.]